MNRPQGAGITAHNRRSPILILNTLFCRVSVSVDLQGIFPHISGHGHHTGTPNWAVSGPVHFLWERNSADHQQPSRAARHFLSYLHMHFKGSPVDVELQLANHSPFGTAPKPQCDRPRVLDPRPKHLPPPASRGCWLVLMLYVETRHGGETRNQCQGATENAVGPLHQSPSPSVAPSPHLMPVTWRVSGVVV